jgi:two-component system cell cycle sensor histidine kinase/response regulator CckA
LEWRLREAEGVRARLEREAEDRDRRERAIRRARKMEAVSRLVSPMVRDHCDVFSIILGYAGIALDGLHEGDPLFGPLTEIRRAGERSVERTRRLLALSRLSSDDSKIQDVSLIVERMSRSIQRVLGETRTLSLRCEALPCPVRGARGEIEQIVMDLVLNARDAMPAGGQLRLEVGMVDVPSAATPVEAGPRPGRHVRLRATDSGLGMSLDVQERLFEPFFTTKEGGAAAGLGLATVYAFAHYRGGHVSVESEPGKGTTLDVYLPEGMPLPSGKELPSSGTTRAARTILVVEDEEQVRLVMERILRRHRYGVLVAASPHEAVSICKEHPGRIDLLVTDVAVAEMNGQTLADKLLETRPEMKVLFLSGHLMEAVLPADAREKAFLQKPVTPEALRQKVRGILLKTSLPPSHRGTA